MGRVGNTVLNNVLCRFLAFSDSVLILGEKSNRPALLTIWLIVIFINICLLFFLWIALALIIYLVSIQFEIIVVPQLFFQSCPTVL